MLGRVLVVDDEVELGVVVKDLLEIEGFEVMASHDAVSAREKLADGKFDLAILDVFLSGGPTGLDLARYILTEFPDTSVILMTGYADKVDIDEACLSGAYTCIAKPFNLDDVLRVVAKALEGRHAVSEAGLYRSG